jgi:hypothetical protein
VQRTSQVGAGSEFSTLERLVEAIREAKSWTLVLRGEPGVGETALFDHLVEHASDCFVARTTARCRAGNDSSMAFMVGGVGVDASASLGL